MPTKAAEGGYCMTTTETIAQLFIAGASNVLIDQVIVNANLAATIT